MIYIYMDPRIHQSAESRAADWLISIMVYIYRACQRRAGKATILLTTIPIGRVRGVPVRQRSSDNNPFFSIIAWTESVEIVYIGYK